jgi:hypothetical protein
MHARADALTGNYLLYAIEFVLEPQVCSDNCLELEKAGTKAKHFQTS